MNNKVTEVITHLILIAFGIILFIKYGGLPILAWTISIFCMLISIPFQRIWVGRVIQIIGVLVFFVAGIYQMFFLTV